jgi:hypothetical protein
MLALLTFSVWLFLIIVVTGWMIYYIWWTLYGLPTDFSPLIFQFFGWQNFIASTLAVSDINDLPPETNPLTWFLYNPLWVLLILWLIFGDDEYFATILWWWFFFYYWLFYFNFGTASDLTSPTNTLSLYSVHALAAVNDANSLHPAAMGKLMSIAGPSSGNGLNIASSMSSHPVFDMVQYLSPQNIMTNQWWTPQLPRGPLFDQLVEFLGHEQGARAFIKPKQIPDLLFQNLGKLPPLPSFVNDQAILKDFMRTFNIGRHSPVFLDFVRRCQEDLAVRSHPDPLRLRVSTFNASSAVASSSNSMGPEITLKRNGVSQPRPSNTRSSPSTYKTHNSSTRTQHSSSAEDDNTHSRSRQKRKVDSSSSMSDEDQYRRTPSSRRQTSHAAASTNHHFNNEGNRPTRRIIERGAKSERDEQNREELETLNQMLNNERLRQWSQEGNRNDVGHHTSRNTNGNPSHNTTLSEFLPTNVDSEGNSQTLLPPSTHTRTEKNNHVSDEKDDPALKR